MSKKGFITLLFFIILNIVGGYFIYSQDADWYENSKVIVGVLIAILFWIFYFSEKESESKKSYCTDAIVFTLAAIFNIFVSL